MPQDQVFEPEIEFDFESTPVKKRKGIKNNDDVIEEGAIKTESPEPSEEVSTQQDIIDNPYLRPGKVPNNKVIGSSSVQSSWYFFFYL